LSIGSIKGKESSQEGRAKKLIMAPLKWTQPVSQKKETAPGSWGQERWGVYKKGKGVLHDGVRMLSFFWHTKQLPNRTTRNLPKTQAPGSGSSRKLGGQVFLQKNISKKNKRRFQKRREEGRVRPRPTHTGKKKRYRMSRPMGTAGQGEKNS